ncbi:MAG: DUF1330 domain-containing protein [Ilumatobacter sp.]|uniref:DUF1330 domain-containing protein n=1 Tax=Ilumatobacter sp. TaxID=1967498 RepID=UPI003C7197C6
MAPSSDLADFYGFDRPETLEGLSGPITLINHFALREIADDRVGSPERSGLEAMLLYAAVSTERLAAVGGTFVMQGLHVGSLWGDELPWDLVVVANYPTPDALFDLFADEQYRTAYVHRRAAVERQRVEICSTIS